MNPTQTSITAWLEASPLRKSLTKTIFILIALILLGKTVLVFKKASNVGTADISPQMIYVNGKAEEYIKPDTLMFGIDINEDGKDIKEATKKTADKVAKAIDILKSNGVEEKNIKTITYAVVDKYENVPVSAPAVAPARDIKYIAPEPMSAPYYPITNQKIVGATVSESLEIKIRDIEKNATAENKAKIIAELAAAGIKVGNFSFTIFDIEAAKADIRAKAIKNGKENAEKLAKQLGVGFGSVAGFTETYGGYNPYISARSEGAMMDKVSSVSNPQLPVGEQKVVVEVTLSYYIK